jgi:predicted short-subunit dehydrogenase-like oxidoreductase (DUF2520 family)
MQTLSIIGAGRLGRTLGCLAMRSGQVRVAGVYCRTAGHAAEAVAFIGGGVPCERLDALPASDLYLLSTPDDALSAIARQLADCGLPAGALVLHASGALDSSVLAPLRRCHVRLGSLHPAFSFADPARAVEQFSGCKCALEGDAEALDDLQGFAALVGGSGFQLRPGGKAGYHAALCMASNYLVTLTGLSQSLALESGVPDGFCQELVGELMRRSLENALALGAHKALTGPIARGDSATVARHVQSLPQGALQEVYLALGRATLQLAGAQLMPEQVAAIARTLDMPQATLPGGD